MHLSDPVGWFGKLPSIGDFASRRLSPDFVATWDEWLSAGFADWRASSPQAWLEQYLAGPTWRFILFPGLLPGNCGRTLWAGVLMPSVDRVGRYFPLTLAQPLAYLPTQEIRTGALLAWLQRLDNVAVDAMHESWEIEQLDAALALEGPTPADPDPESYVTCSLPGLANVHLHQRLHGHVVWLTTDASGRQLLRVDRGLPQGEKFSALLGGLHGDESDPLHNALRSSHEY